MHACHPILRTTRMLGHRTPPVWRLAAQLQVWDLAYPTPAVPFICAYNISLKIRVICMLSSWLF